MLLDTWERILWQQPPASCWRDGRRDKSPVRCDSHIFLRYHHQELEQISDIRCCCPPPMTWMDIFIYNYNNWLLFVTLPIKVYKILSSLYLFNFIISYYTGRYLNFFENYWVCMSGSSYKYNTYTEENCNKYFVYLNRVNREQGNCTLSVHWLI